MERVAGVATGETPDNKPRWQLLVPNGVAVDSKRPCLRGRQQGPRHLHRRTPKPANTRCSRNGVEARFQWLTGLAIDDSDRLFAADSGMKRILVFDRAAQGRRLHSRRHPAIQAAWRSTTKIVCCM